jgi:hypothetical protein
MSTFLSWLWMRAELLPWWQKITLHRHRSELRALNAARSMGPLAIFPILFAVGFWFFLLAALPSLMLFLLSQGLVAFGGSTGGLLGILVYVIHSILAFVAMVFVAAWLFRWYLIAVSLTFGGTAMADRKEAELIAYIAATEAPS